MSAASALSHKLQLSHAVQHRSTHLGACHTAASAAVTRARLTPACRTLAGEGTTVTPAALSAAILSLAVPLPPEMIAPAWPMRRPGGAVRPAMKDTMGFCVLLA